MLITLWILKRYQQTNVIYCYGGTAASQYLACQETLDWVVWAPGQGHCVVFLGTVPHST